MPYTLWSRGRLLGTSEFGFTRIIEKSRAGFFTPTPFGETVMPIACGLSPALMELARASRSMDRNEAAETGRTRKRQELLRQTTKFADVAAAEAHSEALELELRGPDDAVIPTESITLQDTDFLLSLADEDDDDLFADDYDPEEEAALAAAIEADCAILDEIRAEHEGEPDWDQSAEPDLPRYQIFVHLLDDRAIP